jgi:hypothetical protein
MGTTSPTVKLDVNGTINATNILINGSSIGTGSGNITGAGTSGVIAKFTAA